MKTKLVKSRIYWLSKEAGGREGPPPGPRYLAPARFEDEKEKWPNEAWTLVIEFIDPPDESLCMIADVRLLNPEGPVRLLHPGSVFELYEGDRVVAKGEVLDE